MSAALGGALLLGCGGDPKPQEKHCPIGDVSAPAELQIIHLDSSNTVIETQPMSQVPLLPPPQGGWAVLLGVRARNLDGCQATLTTVLVDACDHQIIKLDQRATQLDLAPDGWGVSSLTTFSNLQVCPQATATRDLYNVPYNITVSIKDADGQSATASLTVVPTCPAEASRCACECDRDYVVGAECPAVVVPHGTCSTAD